MQKLPIEKSKGPWKKGKQTKSKAPQFFSRKFDINQGDLKNLLKEDGYSHEAEKIIDNISEELNGEYFLADARRVGNKIELDFNHH